MCNGLPLSEVTRWARNIFMQMCSLWAWGKRLWPWCCCQVNHKIRYCNMCRVIVSCMLLVFINADLLTVVWPCNSATLLAAEQRELHSAPCSHMCWLSVAEAGRSASHSHASISAPYPSISAVSVSLIQHLRSSACPSAWPADPASPAAVIFAELITPLINTPTLLHAAGIELDSNQLTTIIRTANTTIPHYWCLAGITFSLHRIRHIIMVSCLR